MATVMFFPGGLAGLLMMHQPAMRLGNLGLLVVPYVNTLIPAAIGALGLAGLMEMLFHVRHAAVGDIEMRLFWITFDSHTILPWVIAIATMITGFWLAYRNAPKLRE